MTVNPCEFIFPASLFSGCIGLQIFIPATEEVILTAGAIGSPWILLLSGIGPEKELQEKGIHCVVDLPGVGKNMQDHVLAYICYEVKDSTMNPYRAIPGIWRSVWTVLCFLFFFFNLSAFPFFFILVH